MSGFSDRNIPATTEAAAAQAQSREATKSSRTEWAPAPGTAAYALGDGVTRAERIAPYQRKTRDPVYRPLKIFTRDPATSLLLGSIALINVPYEPLRPGPEGALFSVEDPEFAVNLEDSSILIRNGVAPSMSDPGFRSQMVYAVCSSVYAAFRAALGRYIAWGFDADSNGRSLKLTIRPRGFDGENAFYDKRTGSLSFGFYRGDKTKTVGNNLPGGMFFTCLSHDIVAHEVTHALLDGLRANFTAPSTLDVLAFHEGFADLVAIFQRFSYDTVLRAAIRQAGPRLASSSLLTNIAEQFGQTTTGQTALRSAIDVPEPGKPPRQYGREIEPHALGSVLVSAVFDAFTTVFQRKVQPYIRLATNGSGILPPGEISADLVDVLAKVASRLASQFLSILIRAIDYCPPVDIRFGDYLRALITADYDLVPDDPFGYREALIDAFRRRAIFPAFVNNLSEDALIWNRPRKNVGPIASLNFANLRFRGDPQNAASSDELKRQARSLGDVICRPHVADEFGIISPGDAAKAHMEVDLPYLQSIRSTRRVGPDGQVVFDLVAELTQRRSVRKDGRNLDFYGGSTVILGPEGEIRYVISKSVTSEARLREQMTFMDSDVGRAFWEQTRLGFVPKPKLFNLLHAGS
jgi:hypothetical protein